jgi:hypothetical protein
MAFDRQRYHFVFVLALSVWAVLITITVSQAQDAEQGAAEQSATQFWFGFDRGDLAQLYQSLAPEFRNTTSQQQFVQQSGMMRIQSGGPAETRALVGSQALNDMPDFKGQFFYVRFKAKYPNGFVYQDAYLKKSDNSWRVWSFNVVVAPG